jgi:hypothetical protein
MMRIKRPTVPHPSARDNGTGPAMTEWGHMGHMGQREPMKNEQSRIKAYERLPDTPVKGDYREC